MMEPTVRLNHIAEITPPGYTLVEYPLAQWWTDEAEMFQPEPIVSRLDVPPDGVIYSGFDLGGDDRTVTYQIHPLPAPDIDLSQMAQLTERIREQMDRFFYVPMQELVYGRHANNEPPATIDMSDIRAAGARMREAEAREARLGNMVLWGEPTLEAENKAIKLLKENLTDKQRQQFEEHGWFEVVGGYTKRTYRLIAKKVMNICLVNELGLLCKVLCVVPEGDLPLGDVLLSQKLGLELYELDTLASARVTYDMTASRSNGDDRERVQDYWPWRLDTSQT